MNAKALFDRCIESHYGERPEGWDNGFDKLGNVSVNDIRSIANLYQIDRSVVSKHINSIYQEAELTKNRTSALNAQVQNEGGRSVTRNIDTYNLQLILAVGFRVRSHRGLQFRTWANHKLEEYLVKGYVMDDDLKKDLMNGITTTPEQKNILVCLTKN